MYSLSEQYLVDCSTQNSGCNGGYQRRATEFLVASGCIESAAYPYVSGLSGDETTCDTTGMTTHTLVESASRVDANYVSFLTAMLDQPVNISFEIADSFQNYASGIYKPSDCLSTAVNNQINHAMQAVEYGMEGGLQYAIVRNQWGSSWGENGFIKVYMPIDPTDNCGTCGMYL